MRKSELLAIKAREYERGLADAHKKFRVTEGWIESWVNYFITDVVEEDIQGSADYEYFANKVRIDFKDALTEIGVEIVDE